MGERSKRIKALLALWLGVLALLGALSPAAFAAPAADARVRVGYYENEVFEEGAREALQMLELRHTKHEPYNLVLLDWKMPEMDGLALTKEIRKRYDKETTVIILTAFGWDEIMDEALQVGMNAHLSKPVEPERLFETLEELIWEAEEKKRSRLTGRGDAPAE